jgi:hypothetical protein
MTRPATAKIGLAARRRGPNLRLGRSHHGTMLDITAATKLVAERDRPAWDRFGSARCTPGWLLFFKFTERFRWQRGQCQRRRRRQHGWNRRTDDSRRGHESCGHNRDGRIERLGRCHNGDRRQPGDQQWRADRWRHRDQGEHEHRWYAVDRRKRLGRPHLGWRHYQRGWNRRHWRNPQDRRNDHDG